MSIFLWLNVVRAYDFDQAAARLVTHRSALGEREREHLSRIRWQELHHAERSFPCGVALVPEPEGALPQPVSRPVAVPPPPPGSAPKQPRPPLPVPPPLAEAPPMTRPAQVTVAVLPSDIAFLLEDGEGDVEEAGRFPRSAIVGVDVVDEGGDHVPEPIRETIEPSQLVFTVLRWSNEGRPDEDRFAFRSPWLAWRAGRKLMEARQG
jgi:hypothetical protein